MGFASVADLAVRWKWFLLVASLVVVLCLLKLALCCANIERPSGGRFRASGTGQRVTGRRAGEATDDVGRKVPSMWVYARELSG